MSTRYENEPSLEELAELSDAEIDTSDISELGETFWKTARIVEPDITGQGAHRVMPWHELVARPGDLVVTRWGARLLNRRFPCATGRGGVGGKRREGDGVTPAGRHRIEAVLHRPDRIAHRGRAIGPGDGWSDDPADPAYNRPVRRPHRFGHEALRRADRQYDLVAVLDWNRDPPVPGRGSAIFLHVWRRPRHPTAGCIAFRRGDLAFILAHMRPHARVVVRG